jgi:peptidoglycan/LPS O-acetylase OafA/YrhL
MLWLVAVAGFAGAAVVLSEPASTAGAARFSYLGVMAGVVIAGTALAIPAMLNASGGGLVRRLLSSRVLRWLGEISFGIYLYHLPIQWALTRMAILPARGPLRLLAIIAITAPLAIFCAALSWYLVERPFIRLGRRRLRFGRAPMLAEEPIRSIA